MKQGNFQKFCQNHWTLMMNMNLYMTNDLDEHELVHDEHEHEREMKHDHEREQEAVKKKYTERFLH